VAPAQTRNIPFRQHGHEIQVELARRRFHAQPGFWEPRMRTALLAHLDRDAGAGLSDIVLDSLRARRDRIV
jgi:hypothetical protein